MRRDAVQDSTLGEGFQFTHPGKGATEVIHFGKTSLMFQFTHPGKGATDLREAPEYLLSVSIHAPWEGCDSVVQRCVL